jgi:hypothetical protein
VRPVGPRVRRKGYKRGNLTVALGLTLFAHHFASTVAPSPIPFALLAPTVLKALSSLGLVLSLLLLHWICSFGAEPLLLLHFLGATPLLRSPMLNGLARPSSPRTQAHDLCQTGRRSGRLVGAPGFHTDSTDPTAYQSPTGRLRWMEAPVATVVVQLGSTRLVKAVMTARSEVPVVLGVGPVDQWRCVMRCSSSSSSLPSSSP